MKLFKLLALVSIFGLSTACGDKDEDTAHDDHDHDHEDEDTAHDD